RDLSARALHGHHGLDVHRLAAGAGGGARRRGVTNVTWEVVQRDYEKLRAQFPRFCGCDTCRGVGLVFALDRLSPHYVSTRQGEVLTELNLASDQERAAAEGRRRATVRLSDPAPDSGGRVAADVVAGACGGALRLRWPDRIPAAGGTTWVVAGRWVGSYDRGVLVVRRAKLLDGESRGRGALRGRLAARSAALFGRRAPLVDALVFAPNAALDPDVRERYARSGLAHILSISGLHVGFLAAWLALILRNLGLSARHRLLASGVVLLGYLWLLGFPAPAARATVMLVVDDVARLRQRVAAPRGVIAVSALAVLLVDPQALHSVGAWLSVTAIAAVVWAGRATRRRRWLIAARVAFLVTLVVGTSFRDVVLDDCRCLTVFFLDVGQGDAAVLRTPNGRWVAIDGGPRIPGIDAGRRVVIPFLRRHGARRVTLVVATHGDADHLGGLPAVVE